MEVNDVTGVRQDKTRRCGRGAKRREEGRWGREYERNGNGMPVGVVRGSRKDGEEIDIKQSGVILNINFIKSLCGVQGADGRDD